MKHADWTGNGNSIYKTLGATNHAENEREANDYYATEPTAAELLCAVENLSPAIKENDYAKECSLQKMQQSCKWMV